MNSWFNKLFLFLYSSLFLITPLLIYKETSELFEFNKMLFIYLIAVLVFSLWLVKMIVYKRIIIKKTLLDVPFLLFVISLLFSTIFSIDRHTSFFGYYGRFNGGLLSIISYLILYYGFVSNLDKEAVFRLLKMSLIASFLVILWGLPAKSGHDMSCLVFTGSFTNSCWTDQFRPSERMFSTLGQPNWLGAYLAIHFFIGVYFIFKNHLSHPERSEGSRPKGRKNSLIDSSPGTVLYLAQNDKLSFVLMYGYLFLNFSAILFTRSRSALLAVGIGLILLLGYYIWKIFRRDEINPIPTTQLGIGIFLLLLIPTIIFKTGIAKIDRYFSLQTTTSPQNNLSSDVTESFDIRKIVWIGAIELGKRYPLLGTGPETFAYAYYFVRPAEHNLTSEWDFIYNKAHNEFLNYLATTGFIGFSTYVLLIIFVIFIAFYRHPERSEGSLANVKSAHKVRDSLAKPQNDKLLVFCLLLSYLTILITNFFGFSTTTVQIFFYLFPAFFVALSSQDKQYNNITIKQLSTWQKRFLIFPLFISISGVFFIITYFLADINYNLAQNYDRIQEYSLAYEHYQKALAFKNEHVYQDKLSYNLANLTFLAAYDIQTQQNGEEEQKKQLKDLQDASNYYNAASLKASPKNVLYWKTRAKNKYLFYQTFDSKQDYNDALYALKTAIKLAPTDPKLYYSLAMFYILKYDAISTNPDPQLLTDALSLVNTAIKLKPNYRDGYFAKGLILKKMGKTEEAKSIFMLIFDKINPGDEEARKELD